MSGYPDDYDLGIIDEKEAFDLLGNTVCVPVIKQIALRLGEYYINTKQHPLWLRFRNRSYHIRKSGNPHPAYMAFPEFLPHTF